MELNTHYELDQSFVGFDTELLTFTNEHVAYDGVPVVSATGAKLLRPGSLIQGRKVSAQQAISLWQHCYVATKVSYDPEQCARVYRNVRNVCHTCCGDKVVTRWVKEGGTGKRIPRDSECTDCEGSGSNNTMQREEDLWQQPSYQG